MMSASLLMVPTMVPLPSLATADTTITAFVLPSRHHITRAINRNAKRNPMLLATSNGATDDRIEQVLMGRTKELVSDFTLLERHRPRKSADAAIIADETTRDIEQKAREVLLSSRLPGLHFLHRSEVRRSDVFGAGRGLFATEDIPNGEVITCYPGDALLVRSSSSEDGYGKDMLLWGAHVPKTDVWDDGAVFMGTESAPPLTSYSVSVDDKYSVLGHPMLDDDPAYYGHYANDGASAEELDEERGVEESIATYVSKSVEMANAMHKPFKGGVHMVTVATRDIRAGDEILVT